MCLLISSNVQQCILLEWMNQLFGEAQRVKEENHSHLMMCHSSSQVTSSDLKIRLLSQTGDRNFVYGLNTGLNLLYYPMSHMILNIIKATDKL